METGPSQTPPQPPLPPAASEPERWYLPAVPETLRLMRWRLLYFLPALAYFVLLFFFWWLIFWWKLAVLAIGLPMGEAVRTAKHAIRLRTEPFCIHCGYNLSGLPDGHLCPECGQRFLHSEIDEYRRDPHWFIKRKQTPWQHPAVEPFAAGKVRSARRRDGT